MTSYRAGSLKVYLLALKNSTVASIHYCADRELGTLKQPLGLSSPTLLAMY
jgi:hypothetical protein